MGRAGLHIQSATYTYNLTGNIVTPVAGEKYYHIGYIFTRPKSSKRNAVFIFFGSITFFQIAGHIGFYKSRAMALHLILRLPISLAILLVNPIIPALLAA